MRRMKQYYYYLISSLPMLEFGAKTPFSYHDFVSCCQEQLDGRDMEIIKRATILPCEDIEDSSPTLREWKRFDRTLRNEIARSRANKKGRDPSQYIRGENYSDPFMAPLAQWAVSQDSPLEAELYLDRARWERIEQLKKGHYFDIDYLITYALQLQIMERWEKINSEGGMEVLQGLLAT